MGGQEHDRGGAPRSDERAAGLAAPAWITPELIRLTIEVWQPYYATRLTAEDAVIMIQNVGRLCVVLSRE